MPKHLELVLYPENGFTKESILSIIESKRSITEYCFILHDKDKKVNGEMKKPHFHVYLNFGKTNVQIENAAAWFGVESNAVQKIKSNKEATLRYYLHLKCNDDLKHVYDISDMCTNIDVKKCLERIERVESDSEIIKACADGKITQGNYTQFVDPVRFARLEPKMRKAWTYLADSLKLNRNAFVNRKVYWLCGDTGVGKTTIPQLIAKNRGLSIYLSATGSDPFSHYQSESIVVLDDVRPREPFSWVELLKIVDPNFVAPTHSRYSDKYLVCDYIFICSPFMPDFFVSQYYLVQGDNPEQLFRRITELWLIDREKIHRAKYDLEKHQFQTIPNGIVENPAAEYYRLIEESRGEEEALDILDSVIGEMLFGGVSDV